MKRVDRRRVERLRRIVRMIGLSFSLGALADTALTWRLHEFHRDGGEIVSATDAVPRPRTAAPAPVATAGIARGTEIDELKERRLEIPVEGIMPSALRDTFSDSRALGRPHEAIDIMAPTGTPVHAVEDGQVAKLFTSVAGGLTIYQFDPSGMFAYYYAHLDSYARGLSEGQPVRRGETIGYVGSTGNASEKAPHLHFAIFRLTAERQWWKGDAINPYPILK